MWTQIADHITQTTGVPFEINHQQSVSGGCINQGYRITNANQQSYFVKVNQAALVEMFVAEALGLKQMAATQTIRVPRPICWGMADRASYIVLEWLDFGQATTSAWESMGKKLAKMHSLIMLQFFV